MNKKLEQPRERARCICALYHAGESVSVIARQYEINHTVVIEYLDRWYHSIYGGPYKSFHQKRDERAEELKERFECVYVPFLYTRADICRMIDCTPAELDHMLHKFKLTHLRLKTYANQRTLCNVPQENYDEYKKFADDHGLSVRELACKAINEYILDHEGDF